MSEKKKFVVQKFLLEISGKNSDGNFDYSLTPAPAGSETIEARSIYEHATEHGLYDLPIALQYWFTNQDRILYTPVRDGRDFFDQLTSGKPVNVSEFSHAD